MYPVEKSSLKRGPVPFPELISRLKGQKDRMAILENRLRSFMDSVGIDHHQSTPTTKSLGGLQEEPVKPLNFELADTIEEISLLNDRLSTLFESVEGTFK